MKGILYSFINRQINIEKYLIKGIDILEQIIKLMITGSVYKDLKNSLPVMINLEMEFDDNHEAFNDTLEKRYRVPYYWQDIYEVYQCIIKITDLLNLYYNKSIIYKNEISFEVLFNKELVILKEIKEFFYEYLKNRKYAREILKNLKNENRNFKKIYLNLITVLKENAFFKGVFEIRDIFEQMGRENESIHYLLNKVMIGTSI